MTVDRACNSGPTRGDRALTWHVPTAYRRATIRRSDAAPDWSHAVESRTAQTRRNGESPRKSRHRGGVEPALTTRQTRPEPRSPEEVMNTANRIRSTRTAASSLVLVAAAPPTPMSSNIRDAFIATMTRIAPPTVSWSTSSSGSRVRRRRCTSSRLRTGWTFRCSRPRNTSSVTPTPCSVRSPVRRKPGRS